MPQIIQDFAGTVGSFYSLSPEQVLDAVERAGQRTTGLCYALNSLENRVYEVELEGGERQVVKFYRPGRWSKETILDEHKLLQSLVEADIPACAPLILPSGSSLEETEGGIFFTLFPRLGGRLVEELNEDDYERLGRLIARIHNVSAVLDLHQRPQISPQSYGDKALATILEQGGMSPSVRARFEDTAQAFIELAKLRFEGIETFVVHGDCHRGNLLSRGRRGPSFGGDGGNDAGNDWFFLDFDDSGHGPAVQDLWLLLPARLKDCEGEIEAMLEGYQQFRAFPRESLGLIEILRGLRYLRYAAWVASRWDDPAFKRAFADFGTDRYWEGLLGDLYEQLELLRSGEY